jgi:hypothetical protein
LEAQLQSRESQKEDTPTSSSEKPWRSKAKSRPHPKEKEVKETIHYLGLASLLHEEKLGWRYLIAEENKAMSGIDEKTILQQAREFLGLTASGRFTTEEMNRKQAVFQHGVKVDDAQPFLFNLYSKIQTDTKKDNRLVVYANVVYWIFTDTKYEIPKELKKKRGIPKPESLAILTIGGRLPIALEDKTQVHTILLQPGSVLSIPPHQIPSLLMNHKNKTETVRSHNVLQVWFYTAKQPLFSNNGKTSVERKGPVSVMSLAEWKQELQKGLRKIGEFDQIHNCLQPEPDAFSCLFVCSTQQKNEKLPLSPFCFCTCVKDFYLKGDETICVRVFYEVSFGTLAATSFSRRWFSRLRISASFFWVFSLSYSGLRMAFGVRTITSVVWVLLSVET